MAIRMRRMLFCLALLLAPLPCHPFRISKDASSQWPAFCSRILPSSSDIWRRESSSSTSQKSKLINLKLDYGETACIQSIAVDSRNQSLNESQTVSLFHVFRYSDFHQEYPIAHQYTFAVPYLRTNCTCDCPGGNRICSLESKYKNCEASSRDSSTAAICRRTYHSNQNAVGCSNSEDYASVCCEVYASPYKNQKFIAVDVSRPTSFGKLSYEVYDGRNAQWTKIMSQDFEVSFDKMSRVQFSEGSIVDLRVMSQRSYSSLQLAMYFYPDAANLTKTSLRSTPAINWITEWSSAKLGWFRFNDTTRQWFTDQTSTRFQNMLNMNVLNCKDQKYEDSFGDGCYIPDYSHQRIGDAHDDPEVRFGSYIGRPIEDRELWILETSVPPGGRQIVVKHRDPPPVTIDFELNVSTDAIHFIHHLSYFRDFEAEVRLDASSNRYLKLTLIDAKGVISGMLYESERSQQNGMAFSVSNVSTSSKEVFFIRLPQAVNKDQHVCLTPNGGKGGERCQWAKYHETPIEVIDISSDAWVLGQGHCPGCNDDTLTWGSFLKFLDPRQWISGISGLPKSLAFGVEMVFYIAIVILVIAVCRRFVCPVVRWAACGVSSGRSEKG